MPWVIGHDNLLEIPSGLTSYSGNSYWLFTTQSKLLFPDWLILDNNWKTTTTTTTTRMEMSNKEC